MSDMSNFYHNIKILIVWHSIKHLISDDFLSLYLYFNFSLDLYINIHSYLFDISTWIRVGIFSFTCLKFPLSLSSALLMVFPRSVNGNFHILKPKASLSTSTHLPCFQTLQSILQQIALALRAKYILNLISTSHSYIVLVNHHHLSLGLSQWALPWCSCFSPYFPAVLPQHTSQSDFSVSQSMSFFLSKPSSPLKIKAKINTMAYRPCLMDFSLSSLHAPANPCSPGHSGLYSFSQAHVKAFALAISFI